MDVIFDNDGSSDDAVALIYLLTHPDVVIKGITVAGTGEVHGSIGAQNIADLCKMLGQPDLPIAYGNDKTCDESGKPFPDWLRTVVDELLKDKGVPKNTTPTITDSPVKLINEIIAGNDKKITVVATGPLTNIAEFIKADVAAETGLINQIEKIVIMGGAVSVDGNIKALDKESENELAEWNIYADPKAADIVFSSGIPITLVPLDATNQVPMTEKFYNSLSTQIHPALQLIYQMLKVIVDNIGMEGFINHFYLWDPLAAMICVDPMLAVTESMPLIIDPQTAQTKRVENGSSMIDVATKIPQPELILDKLINEIKSNLIAQLTGPVKWTQTVEQMIADGATQFTECGPGKVLQGLVTKINREVQVDGIG